MYKYKTKVVRWVDGDTLLCLIDLGFYTHKEERLRLARIDAPEPRGAEKERGKEVQRIITERYPPGTELLVESKKRDNYGRFIAELFYGDESVNQWLIDSGNAKEVKY
ncbi:MAG: thermonuclease family protein [Flavobacteriales bacterium]|nr:thermonuclease family protein [Flavobacteriales bacterium]